MVKYPTTKLGNILLSVIFCCLFAYPFIFLPLGPDQGIFAYIGTIINNGGVPFIDAWDLKPPIVYYLYSLGLKIFGHSMFSLRLFDFVYFSLTIFAVYHLGMFLFDKKTGVFSGFLLGILYFFTNDFFTLSQCESFMILPMILSVYFCCAGIRKQSKSMLLCSGLFLGIVFMTKITGVLLLFSIGLYILSETYRQEGKLSTQLIALRIFIIVSGMVIFLMLFSLWFYNKGGLSELLYTLFVYDAEHFRSALNLKKDYAHVKFAGFMRRYIFVLIPAFFSYFIRDKKNKWPENLLLLSWAFVTVLAFILQGRFYPYHILPLIAPLSIIGAQGSLKLWSDSGWNKNIFFFKKKLILTLVVGILFFAAARTHLLLTYHFTCSLASGDFSLMSNDRFFKSNSLGFSIESTKKVARYIKDNTSREDYIYIWGFASLIYFLSERQAPTRFPFNAPLIAPFNSRRDLWRQEFLSDIKETPPKYILVCKNDYLQNLLMSNIVKDSFSNLRDFPEFFKFLEQHYYIDNKIDNFILYHYFMD